MQTVPTTIIEETILNSTQTTKRQIQHVQVELKHLNLPDRELTTAVLINQQSTKLSIDENNMFAAAIQEAYAFQSKIASSMRKQVFSHHDTDRPRAAIKLNTKTITFVCLYLPPSTDVTPILQRVQRLCLTYNNVIICGDLNAHHSDWMQSRTDARGREVANLFASLNYHLINDGDKPTFYTVRDGIQLQSIIDFCTHHRLDSARR